MTREVPTPCPRTFEAASACLLLASAMCVLPFLLPRHFPPIRTFYDEWIAFALAACAIGIAAIQPRQEPMRVPALAIWLSAFALVLLVRSLTGEPAYPQSPALWAIYVAFAATLVVLGSDLSASFGVERTCDVLAAFLLTGALINAIAGVLQVVGIPRPIDEYFAYLNGTRAIGNIGQPNLYANYLGLGVASLTYLFAREKIRHSLCVAAATLLLTGIGLAASRASTIYAILGATLGYTAMRSPGGEGMARIGRCALAMALAGIPMQWLVPEIFKLIGFSIESGFLRPAAPDWDGGYDESTSLRILGWDLSWKIFATAPIFGVGPGEFAGAAFSYGLPSALAAREIWTSPHNLVLQLLAEAGLIGAFLGLTGLGLWLLSTTRTYFRTPTAKDWWILTCAGIEVTHALLEYPFWYAHFLGVTALLLGIGAQGHIQATPRAIRAAFASFSIAGAVVLGFTLRDYFRFERVSPMFAGRSLASDRDFEDGLRSLADLNGSLIAPRAELWLFLAFPIDESRLQEKLAIGERVMRSWPIREVVLRQCVYLALAGQEKEARELLEQARRTFTTRARITRDFVRSAPEKARLSLESVLDGPRPQLEK